MVRQKLNEDKARCEQAEVRHLGGVQTGVGGVFVVSLCVGSQLLEVVLLVHSRSIEVLMGALIYVIHVHIFGSGAMKRIVVCLDTKQVTELGFDFLHSGLQMLPLHLSLCVRVSVG